jgi:uncharacterized protein YcnI
MPNKRRVVVGAVTVAATLVLMASPAFAHVTIDPDSVPKGTGDVVLSFRIPNEEANANTTKIDMQLPTDHPIAVVDVEPTPGWTSQVTTTHLATPITTDDGSFSDIASEIVWTGGQIAPGQYQSFNILAQGIPDNTDSLMFPVIQTYSDGTTVSWIDPTVPGQPAPDHPAPVLTLTAAQSSDTAGTATTAANGGVGSVTTATVVKKETNNTLGIIAIILGAAALIIAIVALTRRSRTATAATSEPPAPPAT